MTKKVKKETKIEREISEYPLIYSYIYEREVQDIENLSEKMKKITRKKPTTNTHSKTIVKYEVRNGKVVPVFKKG